MRSLPIIFVSLIALLLAGCGKDSRPQREIDREIIMDYLADNNIAATEHYTGLFYRITREGTGPNPSGVAKVTVRYKGYMLDGTVFDETPPGQTATFFLTELIPGWQVGVPFMKRGGAATLFLPSYLGYGSRGSGDIPPNTVIAFDIELIEFVE